MDRDPDPFLSERTQTANRGVVFNVVLKVGVVPLESALLKVLVLHLDLHVVDALDDDEPGFYILAELDGDSSNLVQGVVRRQHVAKVHGLKLVLIKTFEESSLFLDPLRRLEIRHELGVLLGHVVRRK